MKYRTGSTLIMIIVFGALFLMSMTALLSLFIIEHRVVQNSVASERAFQIAEAGLNQYRWILAHNPTDYDGFESDYKDSAGNTIGHYTVEITPPIAGSSIITITSTGWTFEAPTTERVLRAQYGKPSYAEFAFLANSNVWFGEDEEVKGRLHSNGGIRMDGVGDSLTTTIKETYICGPEHGCNNEEKPGIWGTGEDPLLWDFPIADSVDFDVITIDLETMQDAAASDGVLLGPSNNYGYHILFNNDGTFTVYDVTALKNPVWGYNGIEWTYESNDIKSKKVLSGYSNVPIPANGMIFVEDQTWVSGEVNGRVTVAAAKLPEGSGETQDIIINGNIEYYPDRTSGSVLGLIAQEDILVPLYSPTNLEVDAALMAQYGHVYRYYYYPSYYPSDTIKDYIETYGTIITNTTWTWTWVDGNNEVISGYEKTETLYDPNLMYAPPPFFPTRDEYTFISWEEISPNQIK